MASSGESSGGRESRRQGEQSTRKKKASARREPRPPPSATYRLSEREWDPLCIPVAGLWPPDWRVSGRHVVHTRQLGIEDQVEETRHAHDHRGCSYILTHVPTTQLRQRSRGNTAVVKIRSMRPLGSSARSRPARQRLFVSFEVDWLRHNQAGEGDRPAEAQSVGWFTDDNVQVFLWRNLRRPRDRRPRGRRPRDLHSFRGYYRGNDPRVGSPRRNNHSRRSGSS